MSESWKHAKTAFDERADDVRAPQWEEAVAASVAAGALVPAGDSADDAPLAADHVAGNLRRYARWQWRDYWQRRGFWLAGAALLGVWFLSWVARHGGPQNGLLPPDAVLGISHIAFAVGGFFAGLLGTGGIVARERERGLQRFLFAKPVHIVRYYLQGLALNGVGSLLVLLGAVLLATIVLPSAVPVASLLAAAAMAYAAASGVTFLVSTLLRWDAPIAGAWLAVGMPMAVASHEGLWWAQILVWLFPQGPALAVFRAIAPSGVGIRGPEDVLAPATAAGLVAVVYGLACVAGGVAVLRRRSIQA